MKESEFQARLITELKDMFPGSIIMKTDPNYKQGVPDLLILFESKWAALECKRSAYAPHRPNQDWYVQTMNGMSFARFIYPENKEAVLNELQQALRFKR